LTHLLDRTPLACAQRCERLAEPFIFVIGQRGNLIERLNYVPPCGELSKLFGKVFAVPSQNA